ncbi:MAG: hypothetical protein IJ706_06640 [Clostridia bacterium]|nr:hypothetical protein [Clostridia bacterium]
MKNGDFIFAQTHAEFLNKAFGTNYKGWMKCVWKYNDAVVWMVRFNETDGGWRNTFISDNRIKEENIGGHTSWDGKPLEWLDKIRIVMEITGESIARKYTFRGIFKYNENDSDPKICRYYDKISDEIIVR